MTAAAGVDDSDWIEDSLQDLYEHAPCGYLSTTPAGVVVKVNRTYLALTGYTGEQIVGQPFGSMLATGSQLLWETRCLPVLRLRGELREIALVVTTAGGVLLSILLNATVVTAPDGRPRLIRTAVFDATQRQDYERDLLVARRAAERSEEQVRVLQTASVTFDLARTPDDVATSLARIARTAFDATSTAVMFLDEPAGVLRSAGKNHNPIGDTVRVGAERPEAEALRLAAVVSTASIEESETRFPDIAAALETARLAAITVVPLLEDGAGTGVVACFYGRRREIDTEQTELQRALARQASQALQRIRLHDELHHMAQHDTLTGLANRASLQSTLALVVAASSRDQRPMAVIFLDLDGFKAINDQLGHTIGDDVLVLTAQRLRTAVRYGDTIARFGGDEFIVICADTDAGTAIRIADRIRDAVRQPLPNIPPALPLTVSIGVAVHHPDGQGSPDPDGIIRSADAAMYRSKRDGKDRNTVVQT